MKIYYLKALTLLSCLFICITSHAHDFSALNSDGKVIYYNITSSTDLTCGVTYQDYSGSERAKYSGDITIPETITYNGTSYSVTSIDESAFEDCSGLTIITIPNSIISIGNFAFGDCSGLTSITIPNSIAYIAALAFSSCSSLTSIVVESGNAKYDSRNNCNAIIETASNTLITGCVNTRIPNSVTSIGEGAFAGCTGLTNITIPNSVVSIGSYAFSSCSSLTSIVVESGNTVYDSRDNCNAIIETATNTLIAGCKNTIIPNSVVSIGEGAFAGCSGLTNITIPNSVTSIGYFAFCDCSGLTSVTIPNSVTSISEGTFEDCYGLTRVTIPNSVTSIGDFAFYDCDLTRVTIPNSVTSIGEYAFHCGGLISVTCMAINPPVCGTDAFECVNATLTVPKESVSLYQSAGTWRDFENITGAEFSGIEDVIIDGSEDTPVEYYNLQGVRVENPERGVYIKRQAGKTTKVVL